jgi:hypothetical protein
MLASGRIIEQTGSFARITTFNLNEIANIINCIQSLLKNKELLVTTVDNVILGNLKLEIDRLVPSPIRDSLKKEIILIIDKAKASNNPKVIEETSQNNGATTLPKGNTTKQSDNKNNRDQDCKNKFWNLVNSGNTKISDYEDWFNSFNYADNPDYKNFYKNNLDGRPRFNIFTSIREKDRIKAKTLTELQTLINTQKLIDTQK